MSLSPTHPRVSVLHIHPIGEPAAWILQLSKQLRANGVDALLDVWEIKYGQDVYTYLENAITDESLQHVLLMVDEVYLEQAKDGKEAQILRPLLYDNPQQVKIIPVLNLPLGYHQPLPPYLVGRLSIDFSKEEAYEQLLRTIVEQHKNPKPPLGTLPSATDLKQPHSITLLVDQQLQQLKQHQRIDEESQAFFEAFTTAYKTSIEEEFEALRNAWRKWLEGVVGTRKEVHSLDTGLLIETLEQLKEATVAANQSTKELLLHELFLISITIGFKKRNFKYLGKLLHGNYYWNLEGESSSFITFNSCSDNDLGNLTTAQAEETAQQLHNNLTNYYASKDLVEADLMGYYIALMRGYTWVPFLAKYLQKENYPISWLRKLDLKPFFHKTKALYGIEEAREFAKGMNIAFLLERQQLPLPFPVLPLQKTGVPRVVCTKE